LIGPLLESQGYNAIVTTVDVRTKGIKLKPSNVILFTMRMVCIRRDQVYREEGLLRKVNSDHGPQFMSRFMKDLYTLIRVEGN
jgi:hypothetical protein